MVKKPRENRVPIMMSDDELAQIDDWRFGNRIATRSDAVRRLCQIALALDRSGRDLFNSTMELQDGYEHYFKVMMRVLDREEFTTSDADTMKTVADKNFAKYLAHIGVVKKLTKLMINFKEASDVEELIARAGRFEDEIRREYAELDREIKNMSEKPNT